MEILILPALALVLWLLKRSVDDRERLFEFERHSKARLEYLNQRVLQQQEELTRLHGMSLELLRGQTAVTGRVNQLVAAGPASRQLAASGAESRVTPTDATAAELARSAEYQAALGTSPGAAGVPATDTSQWDSAFTQASTELEESAWDAARARASAGKALSPDEAAAWDGPFTRAAAGPEHADFATAGAATAAEMPPHAALSPAELAATRPTAASVSPGSALWSSEQAPGAAPTSQAAHGAEGLAAGAAGAADANAAFTPATPSAEGATTGAAAGGSAPPGWVPPAPPTPAFTLPLADAAHVPAEPAPPPKPAFDWETLLGVRGAAWLGAIALVIAGTLFAKYSIENGLISPSLRIAFLVLLAVGALGSSEFLLRPRYAITADALCGGGVAILYAALFAAHNLYHLVGLVPTFALMALTTLTAALLALRYGNVYIAVLGMLGGFVTPLALSTGQDRPYALFGYILMLDLGFLALRCGAAGTGWRCSTWWQRCSWRPAGPVSS